MSTTFLVSLTRTQALAGWLRAFVVGVSMLLVGMVAWYEWMSYEATLEKGEVDARLLAGSLAQHAEDTLEMADVLLLGLSDRLQTAERAPEEVWTIGEGVANQLRQTPKIRSIAAYDQGGRPIVSSQLQIPDWRDIKQTDAFVHHQKSYGTTLLIGAPTRSYANNDWIIPVTRRLSAVDGSFAGMLVATIRVEYFSEFYSRFGEEGEKGLSLMTRSGILLSRFPLAEDKIGKNYASQTWFPEVLVNREGSLRFVSPVDRVERIHGYRSASNFPLTMVVGIDRTIVLSGWLRSFVLSILGAGSAIVLFAFLGLKLARHVGVRQRSETALSEMARTDGLTGIANRRRFDELLGAMCASTSVASGPVSLLLLDVDHFKLYNDRYGHLSGDQCLRDVASAIKGALFRPADTVARYGGEEFAVLLQNTDERSAVLVAERLRMAVLNLAHVHDASPTASVVTVSIGCTTKIPKSIGDQPLSLIEAADKALYLAKSTGRNRVQTYYIERETVHISAAAA